MRFPLMPAPNYGPEKGRGLNRWQGRTQIRLLPGRRQVSVQGRVYFSCTQHQPCQADRLHKNGHHSPPYGNPAASRPFNLRISD